MKILRWAKKTGYGTYSEKNTLSPASAKLEGNKIEVSLGVDNNFENGITIEFDNKVELAAFYKGAEIYASSVKEYMKK